MLVNILQKLQTIPDVLEVTPVEWLPHELAHRRRQAIFEAVDEGILVVNEQGTITLCNRKAAEVLGWGDTLMGSSLKELGFP